MNAKRTAARLRQWRGLACLALSGVLLGIPGLALASPGCQYVNGQSGTLASGGFVEFLQNSQPVNQGDKVTLTTSSGPVLYIGSFIKLTDNGGTVSGTEGGSGASADGIENIGGGSATYSITCTSVAPTFSGVSPSSGASGSTVTITGTGFYGTSRVTFGGVPVTNFTVNDATSITATVPDGMGTVAIGVITDGGQVSGGSFAFAAPTANAVSATVAFDSSNNVISLSTTGNPTSVTVVSKPSHGKVSSGGTSISYTPTAGYTGADAFTYAARNAAGTSSPATVSITVTAPTVTLSPTTLNPITTGVAFAQSLAASGGTSPYTYSVTAGALPTGLNLNSSSGLLSGTPTMDGPYSFTVQATDSSSGGPYTGTQAYSGTVNAPSITISPASGTLNTSYGLAYSQTFTASGGTAPYQYSITSGALPAGLGLNNNTGVLSGTPTQSGNYPITLTVTDSTTGAAPGSHSQNYTLTVAAATITITPSTLSSGAVGTAYTSTLSATGGFGLYSYKITSGSLPAGLSLNPSGTLIGTPTAAGNFSFTVTATDQNGATGSQAYSNLSIGPATLTLSPSNLPAATAEAGYTQSFNVSGGTSPYTYAISAGAIPPGLSLSSAGTLQGIPSAAGNFNFTVRVTDSSTGTGAPFFTSQSYVLMVNAPSITIIPSTLPAPQYGTAYNQQLTSSGGNGSYTYSISSGALPTGLTLSSAGLLSGTPTAGGTFNVTVTARDGLNFAGSQAYTLSVSPPAAPTAANASASTAYNTATTINLAGSITGVGITAVTIGVAPTHGTASVSGETVIYTPAAGYAGSDSFTYTASNAGGTSSPAVVTIIVSQATQTITFVNPGAQNFGTTPTLAATATSGLTVTFTSSTTAVCTVTSFGALTFVSAGTCTINADQAGNGVYLPAPTVSQSFTVNGIVPGAPTIGTAVAGNRQATVNFTAPASSGGSSITSYTVTSSPGGMTGTCASSPCTVTGLVNGTAYTFTVTATNGVGTGSASAASNAVTPKGNQTITFANPGTQNFGTSPTLMATASSGLPVSFTSSTAAVCTITGGGALTTVSPGTCSINANQGGNGEYLAAPQVSQSFAIATPAAPTVANASASTAYSTATTINLAGSITGVDITAVTAAKPTHGTVSVSGETVTYTPAPTFYGGTDSFTYTATNLGGTSSPATVTVTVGAPAAPAAASASATTTYNTAATINLASEITGVDITAVTIGTAPAHGTVSVSGETVTYTPASTFYGGTDSFTYTATNPGGTSSPATVTVTVGKPAAPTAANASASTAYNMAATINLASAITGVDVTAVTIGTAPTHGTVSVSGETVTYTPSSTFYGGTDSFTYTATNPGGTSASATVTVTVGKPAAPTVTAKSATTPYNTAASIDLSGSIAGVDITSVTIGTAPAHGTVSVSGETVTYTPSSTFYGGTDTFTVTATNPGGASSPATVTVTVGAPAAPTTANTSASTAYNTAASINLASAITGVDITAVTVATQPKNGTVSVSGETVTYTPSSTFYGGTDTFTYTATNPGGISAPAMVTVTVGAPAAPTAANASATTAYNAAATINLASAITGVDITAVTIASQPAHGTVSMSGETVTYTPSSTFYGGTDSFTYTATNPGGTSASATVTVTVGKPSVPTATAKSATTPYNTTTTINLANAITGVDITAVTVTSQPRSGAVSVSGETVTYTPSSTFYGGSDSFTYTATNPGGTSSPAAVTVNVTPLSVPTAQAISVSTTTGTPVLVEATTGATGPQPLTGVSVASAPAHGSASASGGQITYTPAAGFVGSDSFNYLVANHFGNSAPATITVAVTAAGRLGAATGTRTVTTTPGAAVTVNLAQIVPGTYVSSALTGLSPGNAGQATLSQPTTLTFTPAAGFHGLVQLSAVLTSASGSQVTIDVLVLVSTQPDPSKNPDVLGLANAQTEQAQRFAQSQLDNIDSRLETLHDGGGTALFSNTLSISLDGRALQAPQQGSLQAAAGQPGSQAQVDPVQGQFGGPFGTDRPGMGAVGGESSGIAQPVPSAGAAVKSATGTGSGPAGLGLWIAGTANFGTFEAYRQAAGFDSDDIAVNVGVDQHLNPHALIGFSLGYNHDNADIANDGTRSIANGYSAAMYGSYQPTAQTYVDLVLGGGGLSFDSRRYDADSGSFLSGRRNGSEWFGSLTAGYEYHNAAGLLLSPYLRLEQSLSELDGFSEQGAATAALTYGSQTVRTSLAILGLRASEQFTLDWGTLAPHARLEVGHDFQGTSNTTLSYAFIPSAGSWNVLTNPYAANGTSVQLGFGLDLQLPRDLRLTTDYEYLAQPHAHDQMIRFGLDKQF